MNFYVVSDSPQTKNAEMKNYDARSKRQTAFVKDESMFTVEPLQGKSYASIPVNEILNGGSGEQCRLNCRTEGRR